jgi:GAF domain-containing protein/PAS domain-containing protein
LQQGDLEARASVDSADEVGRLANTFNLLASQVNSLADDLEAEAVKSRTQLLAAIESITEGFSLYDSEDRLVLFNDKYREILAGPADKNTVSQGVEFETVIRAAAGRGRFVEAVGREEEWVTEQVERHHNPHGVFEQQHVDGRWLQINEYETGDGGVFGIYSDVTARTGAELLLRRQNDYLEALHKTAVGLISHLNLNELLEDIMIRAGQLLGTKHSYVYLVEATGAEIERKVGVGTYAGSVGFRMKPGEGVAGKVWQTGSPLVVNEMSTWTGRSPNANYVQIASLAGVPLISRSKVVGVLGMAHELGSGEQFDDGEIKLLSRFAQLASLALDNAQLYTTAQEEKKRSDDLLNVVIPIGVALSAEQNFDRLLEKILLEAKAFCNSDGGTLYLRTDSDDLKFVIVRNDSLNIAMGGASGQPIDFPPIALYNKATGEPNHSNVAAHVALTGKSISIPDAYEAEGFNFSGTKSFDENTGYRSTSFLTIPLKNAHDYVVGVLQLINALEPNTGRVIPFHPSLEQIVRSLSSLATVALEAYIREQTLRQQIRQLRIEIDEVKRKKQVSEIIETDFFQDLQDKAREIRRRSKSSRFEKRK